MGYRPSGRHPNTNNTTTYLYGWVTAVDSPTFPLSRHPGLSLGMEWTVFAFFPPQYSYMAEFSVRCPFSSALFPSLLIIVLQNDMFFLVPKLNALNGSIFACCFSYHACMHSFFQASSTLLLLPCWSLFLNYYCCCYCYSCRKWPVGLEESVSISTNGGAMVM